MSEKQGLLFIVSGPSGCGKDTVLQRLMERHEDVRVSVSATTRAPREGEVDGQDYVFLTKETFLGMVEKGEILEYAEYNGCYYGSIRKNVDALRAQGKNVVLKIEVQGAAQIRARGEFVTSVFILPPSMQELERRLRKRGTDEEEAIYNRLAIASREVRGAIDYDYLVVNDDVDAAAEDIARIICAQQFHRENMKRKIKEVLSKC